MPILHWLTREQDLKASGRAPYRLLEHIETYGDADTQNMIIQGDNLDALKALLPYYAGKVKCIYIDPPYNTKSAFEHYDDNLEHTVWLSMMYPRLELLRDLLSEDGSIWVSCDDNEGHYLKVVMDEIFGRKNFIRNIIWHKTYTTSNDAKGIPSSHDHILCYRKSDNFKRGFMPRTDKQNSLYKYDDGDGQGAYRTDNLSVKTYSKAYDYPIENPNTGQQYCPPKGRCWMTSLTNMDILITNNNIFWGKNKDGAPQYKRYANKVQQGIVPQSYWSYDECGHNDASKKEGKALFPDGTFGTPKPEKLIKKIIGLATNEGDLVLDSFLGSATTAAVAHKMGRQYIGIEIGEHAITHCIPRLQKVIEGEQGGISVTPTTKAKISLCKECKENICEECADKIGENQKGGKQVWFGGGGFSFYKLGEPIFSEEGSIYQGIKFPQLAAHIWFSETGIPIQSTCDSPLLGIHDGTAYYLLYNGILKDKRANGGNVLTNKVLQTLPKYDGMKIIYGERSLFSPQRLKEMQIIFKQTPYDIKGR